MIGQPVSQAQSAQSPGSETSDAILLVDPSGVVRFVTAAAGRLVGCAPQEIAGQNVQRLIAQDAAAHSAWQTFAADPKQRFAAFTWPMAASGAAVRCSAWRLPQDGGFVLTCRRADEATRGATEEQRRAERFRALYDVNQAIGQLDLPSVLEVVYRKLSGLMDTTTFFIGLYEAATERVKLVGAYDHGQRTPDEYQASGEGITGLVLRTTRKLVVHDTEVEPMPPEVIIQDEQPRSVMMMPLLTQDEIVGVITVQSYVPNAYTDEDEIMLETIAGAVATAVRNAQLYDETRERADQLAEANARLEAQDALRRELVYQITHDIRGPLQVIYGYADAILEGLLGPVTPDQQEMLSMILKRGRAIEAMTLDIMAVGPISRDALDLAPVDLIAVCEQAAHDARIACSDERFRFVTVFDVDRLTVQADYNRLNRVFDNLLNNAVKFSPLGGTVTLRAGLNAAKTHAQISITDQGVGIPAEKLPFIFERFYRAHRQQHAQVDGSGLGLFIVQQIIEAHNGRVWVDSQEGGGSTFTFSLPLPER